MWWQKVMAIVANSVKGNKTRQEKKPNKLVSKDIEFIQQKLQTSDYKGFEFEKFYQIWLKLENLKKELKAP